MSLASRCTWNGGLAQVQPGRYSWLMHLSNRKVVVIDKPKRYFFELHTFVTLTTYVQQMCRDTLHLPFITRESMCTGNFYAGRSGLISPDSRHQKISSSGMIRKIVLSRKHNKGGIYQHAILTTLMPIIHPRDYNSLFLLPFHPIPVNRLYPSDVR